MTHHLRTSRTHEEPAPDTTSPYLSLSPEAWPGADWSRAQDEDKVNRMVQQWLQERGYVRALKALQEESFVEAPEDVAIGGQLAAMMYEHWEMKQVGAVSFRARLVPCLSARNVSAYFHGRRWTWEGRTP